MLAALVMFGAVGLVLGGFIWLGIALERKRDRAMQRVAASMGWGFSSESDVEALRALTGDLPLLACGHTREVERMMQGRRDGHDVAVVDFCWHDGRDSSRITKQQTVAVIAGAGAALPHFAVEPAGAARRLAGTLRESGWSGAAAILDGWMDELLTPETPSYGAGYRISATDPSAARAALGSRFAELLEEAEDWQIQSCGRGLAVFRAGAYVPAEDVEKLVADAERFADALGTNVSPR